MAIAFDAASNNRVSSATSLTISHTCSGSDRALFIGVTGRTTDTITGATYNGVSATQVDKSQGAGGRWTYLFCLINPASGTNNIVVSATASDYIEANSASYTGVEQTGQPEASGKGQNASATSLSVSVTTVTDNAWVVGVGTGQAGTITAGASTTRRATNLVGAILDSGGAVTPAGARSITHVQVSLQIMSGVAAAIAPSSAPAATSIAMRRAFPRAILNF